MTENKLKINQNLISLNLHLLHKICLSNTFIIESCYLSLEKTVSHIETNERVSIGIFVLRKPVKKFYGNDNYLRVSTVVVIGQNSKTKTLVVPVFITMKKSVISF